MSFYRDRTRGNAESLVIGIEGNEVVSRFLTLAEKHVITANITARCAVQIANDIGQCIADGFRTQAATCDLNTQRGIAFTIDLAHQISSKSDGTRVDVQLGSAEADGVVAIGKRALSNGIATDVFTFCSTERAVEGVASQQTTT